MNKLFDLRFVIGSFFLLTGLILFIYSFTDRGRYAVNHFGGLGFLIFGLLMILITYRKKGDQDNN